MCLAFVGIRRDDFIRRRARKKQRYQRILRVAGWFSGIFFLVLGLYFEVVVIGVWCLTLRHGEEWNWFAVYALVPLVYGIHVIWRLSVSPKDFEPPVPSSDEVELKMIIRRLESERDPAPHPEVASSGDE